MPRHLFLPSILISVCGFFLLVESALAGAHTAQEDTYTHTALGINRTYIQSIESNACVGLKNGKVWLSDCSPFDLSQVWQLQRSAISGRQAELRNTLTNQCLGIRRWKGASKLFLGACGISRNSWIQENLFKHQDRVRIRFPETNACLSSNVEKALSRPTAAFLEKAESCTENEGEQVWAFAPYPLKIYSWNDHITSNCYVFNDYQEKGWWRIPPSVGRECKLETQKGSSWVLASYNEGIPNKYVPGEIIPPGKIGAGRLWNFSFEKQKAESKYSVLMSLDKLGTSDYLDQFTWVGLQDSFDRNNSIPRPDLSENLYVDIEVAIHNASRGVNENVVNSLSPKDFWKVGKSRVHLGVMLRWESVQPAFRINETYNLEVVFWRDPEYDGCTESTNWWGPPAHAFNVPCDITGAYDRRAAWGDPHTGNGGGEAVYYTGPGVKEVLGYGLPEANPNGQFFTYRIPISKLVRAYKWKRPPPSWSNVRVAGVYVGAEVWGKAKVEFEFKNYRLYALPSSEDENLDKR